MSTTVTTKEEEVPISSSHPDDDGGDDDDVNDEDQVLNLSSKKGGDENQLDYDEIERELGIMEFMRPSTPGFSAVVKARYSDFLVHEVRMDGVIARLTSRDLPTSSSTIDPTTTTTSPDVEGTVPTPGTNSTGDTPTSATKTFLSDEEWDSKQAQLSALINNDSDCAQKVMTLLKAHSCGEDSSTPYPDKFVTMPALDKVQRTSIHKWIRETLYDCARTDTLNERVRIWHISFEKEMPNYEAFKKDRKRGNDQRNSMQSPNANNNNNKRNKKSWPKDRPEFLQFVLYKENMDTTTAAKELSRKGSKARIGYAGMKDKRGVTAQFCTMQHTEPQQILSIYQGGGGGGGNSKLRGGAIVQIGNFEYVANEMRLGTLKGNRFDLVLRNVQTGNMTDEAASKELLQSAADSMKESGFINYFGTQRFGKYQDTHLVRDRC